MASLSIILVDDEKLARDRLRRMLEKVPEYEVVAEASNGKEAIEQVQLLTPDILLMDIRMPGMDGLEAAQHLLEFARPPSIIFCTAYDEYALSAFDVQAVDYLLKPVRKERLLAALERAQRIGATQIEAIRSGEARTHITIKSHAGIELLNLDDISHFMADQKYVSGFSHGREMVIDDSLRKLEQELPGRFLKIHRNCLVAISYIEGLVRDSDGKSAICLRGVEAPLSVSRRHLPQVKKVLKTL